MGLRLVDEHRRHRQMGRCPIRLYCHSNLCPLDPYLESLEPLPGDALCLWWTSSHVDGREWVAPPVVIGKLPDYLVFLIKKGVPVFDLLRFI